MHKVGKASGFHVFAGAALVIIVHGDARAESAGQGRLVGSTAPAEPVRYIGPRGHDPKFRQLFGNWQAMERASDAQAHAAIARKSSDAFGRPATPVNGITGAVSSPAPPYTQRRLVIGSISSGFGTRRHPILGGYRVHNGIDLAAPMGTPIVATGDGVVQTAGWNGGYGNFIALDHGGGWQTRYGHMSQINVTEGQRVRKGDIIGLVGSTGRSTGPHLHYEVRVNGQAVDPLSWSR